MPRRGSTPASPTCARAARSSPWTSSSTRSSKTRRTPISTRGSASPTPPSPTLKHFDDAADARPAPQGGGRRLRKALELNPYYIDVRNDLGMALVLAGNAEEGKRSSWPPSTTRPTRRPEIASRNLGQAYFEEKNYAEAANWFRTSLNRNKDYADAYLGLADALVALGRPDEASSTARGRASRSAPRIHALQLALGEAYYRAGRFADARARLEEAARKDPAGADARARRELLKHFPK